MFANARYLFRFMWQPRALLHFHVDSWKFLVLMYLLSLRQAVIASLHDGNSIQKIDNLPTVRRWVALKALKKCKAVVADTHATCEYGRERMGLKNIVMIPEYIAGGGPVESDLARLEAYRSRFQTLISSNAFQIAFHNDEDLYGIDLLIEMVHALGDKKDLGVVFLLPGKAEAEYSAKLVKRLQEYEIEDRFIFIREPLEEASSLWSISDLMIRATNTDGNALSILEALHAGIPVIASDCVERPTGTLLFKSRDVEDLIRAVSEVLDQPELYRQRARELKPEGNAEKIEALYRQWGGGKRGVKK